VATEPRIVSALPALRPGLLQTPPGQLPIGLNVRH
jgi:hypothetical protein